jgi:hypothetical protein
MALVACFTPHLVCVHRRLNSAHPVGCDQRAGLHRLNAGADFRPKECRG